MLELKFATKPPAYVRNNRHLYDQIPSYQYEVQTTTFATKFKQTMDPMERANIFIGHSKFVPEGEKTDAIFAKVDIPAFTVVAFYAGTLVVDHNVRLLQNTLTSPQNL